MNNFENMNWIANFNKVEKFNINYLYSDFNNSTPIYKIYFIHD